MRRKKASSSGPAVEAGFRKGAECAAAIADDYNSSSLHAFRLGDCVLSKLNLSRRKPRRNTRSSSLIAACKDVLLDTKSDVEALMQIAKTLEPEAWAEYVQENGSVANMTGWACLDSIRYAKRLLAAGYRDCAPARTPLPKIMTEDSPSSGATKSPARGSRRFRKRIRKNSRALSSTV